MSQPSKAVFLSPERRALIEAMLRDRGLDNSARAQKAGRAPLRAVPRGATLPLSYAQERLWFLDQLMPTGAAYNIPAAIRLGGRLNLSALGESLKEIARRHETLRTSFASVDGAPVAVISPAAGIDLEVKDLTHVPGSDREERARQLADEEARRPFDLARGPLVRATLLRLEEEEHVLLLTMHHIISDGWSMGVLFKELTALYGAYSGRGHSPLAEMPVQYVDFAVWQREWLRGDALDAQLSYWRRKLGGGLSSLELPSDRPRPAVQSYRGAKQTLRLPDALLKSLKRRSSEQGATLFMTLLAAFKTLLHRYTGQSDLIVGTPIANRNRTEVEGLIGFFANTLVLRTDLSGDPTFAELVKRVREVTLEAYDHQDVPFERLVEELHVERDLSHSPLAQVLFALNNDPMRALELADLEVSPVAVDSATAKFDLTLTAVEVSPGLTLVLEYNTDLFDEGTAARLLRHLERVLHGVAADPHARVSEVALLDDRERHQLLVEWNDTRVDYPEGVTIQRTFEAQAAKSPGKIAVVFEDRRLTYAELNARANQLASYLRKIGVGPEAMVGIAIERSIEMVVGLLGVLKAGAAYVPLDPDYPKERLAFMLDDANVPVLLTARALADNLPAHKSRVVCLDADWRLISEESAVNPEVEVEPRGAAYMIYTSGSTGRPKGAINTHRGICNRLLWMQDAYRLTDADRVLQKTPFSFDVSVWEFFWPLMVGARLVVARPGGHKDSAYLVDLIERQQITVLHFVPSMLDVFLEERGLGRCASLRHVICSGEALACDTEQRFLASLDAELHNLYGPTEAAVDVTFWACGRQGERRSVPIGRPIANTQIYLLDEAMNPVAAGTPGELYIGGVGLARGYHNRAGLTAEKFIPDPFASEPGSRLYRTGDLARYLPEGDIEFLGRIDHQVKIRGFRIELGEIEAAIAEAAGARESVVVAREDRRGQKQLVAYLVLEPARDTDINQLRGYLKERLPEYMVPSAYVVLDRMPLSPNGKLDRRALPEPESGAARGADYVAPSGEMERAIARVWEDVLGKEGVGVNDSFFDLGGNSLLMARARSRLLDVAGRNIPMVDMFRHPTVGALASYLTGRDAEKPSFEQSAARANNRLKALQRQRQLRQKV